MKARVLCASLALLSGLPSVYGASELETLRERVARQEQEIRRLEQLVRSLGGSLDQPSSTTGASSSGAADTYTVKRGDSLERIARRHGCTVAALARANGIKVTKVIHPGQKLRLPTSQAAKPAASDASQPKPTTRPPTSATPTADKYTIKPGDTFSRIARKQRIPLQDLMAANPDVRPERLRPGQVIRLTATAATAATPSSPATPAPKPAAPKPAAPEPARTAAPTIPATATTPATPATPEAEMADATPAPAPASEPPAASTPPAPAPSTPPATAPSPATAAAPPAPAPATGSNKSPANAEKRIRSVTIENEMTYGEFAAKHGTDTERLNELNGLDLNTSTVLAKGSELYVPAEP